MESGIKDMTVLVFKEGRLKKTIQLEGLSFCSGCDGGRDSFTAKRYYGPLYRYFCGERQ